MLGAYIVYQFLIKKINPRRSVGHFIFFVLVNLLVVFAFILILSFVLFQYKDFFFKP